MSEQNYFIIAAVSELTNKATEEFLKKHFSKNNVLFYMMEEDCSFNPMIEKNNCYEIDKHNFHEWQDKNEYYEFPPVDKEILEKMSAYEGELINMMEAYFPLVERFGERQRIYYRTLRFFNALLDKNQINVFILYGIPHQVYDFMVYLLCKIKGIKTILFYRSPVRGYIYTFNDLNQHICMDNNCSSDMELNSDYKKDLDSYLNDTVELYYMPKNTIVGKTKVLMNRLKALKEYKMSFSDYCVLLKRKAKQNKARKFIDQNSIAPDYSKKYIYVGLHYQPEGTTTPMAGVFTNQELMVQYLSYCAPDDVVIYVKEHPNQKLRGEKTRDFFLEISKLRNVYLVPTAESSKKLMDNSLAVATCTGTIAYEAMFKHKPVLLFGHSLYNYRPGAFEINTINDCRKALNKIVCDNGVSITEKEIVDYILKVQNMTKKAEFAVENKEFIVHEGVTLEKNNETFESMLENAIK